MKAASWHTASRHEWIWDLPSTTAATLPPISSLHKTTDPLSRSADKRPWDTVGRTARCRWDAGWDVLHETSIRKQIGVSAGGWESDRGAQLKPDHRQQNIQSSRDWPRLLSFFLWFCLWSWTYSLSSQKGAESVHTQKSEDRVHPVDTSLLHISKLIKNWFTDYIRAISKPRGLDYWVNELHSDSTISLFTLFSTKNFSLKVTIVVFTPQDWKITGRNMLISPWLFI